MEYMSWLQVLTIAGSTIGCCWYFRKETKEEIAEIRAEAKERDREFKEFREKWAQESIIFNEKMNDIRLEAIRESRDFHNRLCAIEEERTRKLFLNR